MDISGVLALKFVVFIFVQGIYCDTECDCNTNKALMELIQKDYLQMRLENFKIMSRLRRLEISKQTVSTQSDSLTAKGSSQSKAGDGLDKLDANYANVKAQSERMKSMEAKITNITAQSEKVKHDIEVKHAKTAKNLERIDKIEDNIIKIEEKLGVMNRNEASSTNGYKMAFDLRNFVRKSLLAEKTGRLMFASDIRIQIENIKHSFSEFKTETATLVHNQSVSLSTKHEAFTEQMTRQVAEVNRQIHTDIGDITLELNKVTEKVSKMSTTLNEITDEDKTDTDCYDVLNKENNAGSGVYSVNLWKSKRTIKVYCDMNTDNGGWTVFQYRFNGSVDFYRNFSEYETGFGNLETEFWLGLKSVKEMASQGKTELRLDLTAADGTTAYETFQNFYLDEGPNYTLHIDHGTGTAGDSHGLSYNNGHHFSTYDADRDGISSKHCAVKDHGGWWYAKCAFANLNGEYVTPGTKRPGNAERGMIYTSFQFLKSLKAVKMMFRRV
ncbi:fibrinogen C domain-containing protein 1-B-like isoform X2 [Mercenaria mercenaria]|uniref:fibrinogen C domain-containing protein 1-B-like isoform X2 n=1 Tax=Mercenaria mercenaria TaxID=6596 RepID=UPI00234ED827|nr:fibrinogen C domain-containing protein 1-B-like isoform X2 [Mercenaria mercenaria]